MTCGIEYYSQQFVLSDPVKKVHRRWAVMMHWWFVSMTCGIEYYSQQSVLSDPVKKVHRRWAVMMHWRWRSLLLWETA
jgi:hypothetical protein